MGGKGKVTVKEEKYGKPTVRTFFLWQQGEFLEKAQKHGLELEKYWERDGAMFQGKPKNWLNFYFSINK